MKWIPTSTMLPQKEGYYAVKFKNPLADVQALLYRPGLALPWIDPKQCCFYATECITAWGMIQKRKAMHEESAETES